MYDLVSVFNLGIIKDLRKHLESVEEENHILRAELGELTADMNNLKRKLRKYFVVSRKDSRKRINHKLLRNLVL